MEKVESRRKFIINIFYFALILTLAFFGFKYAFKWLIPFILGFAFARIVKPVVDFISVKCKIHRKIVSVFVLLLFYALLFFLIWILGAKLITSLIGLFSGLPDFYKFNIYPLIMDIINWFTDLSRQISPEVLGEIENMSKSLISTLGGNVVELSTTAVGKIAGISSNLPLILISFIFTILSSIFISSDYDKVKGFIKKQVPEKYRGTISDIRLTIISAVGSYLRAYGILILITSIELFIGFTIIGINNAIVLAILIALIDIFPILGTGTVVIPWAIISLIQGNIFRGIGLAIIYVAVLLIRQIIEPRIVGAQLGQHPVVTLIAIYIGFLWMGVFGMILLPIFTNILIALNKSGTIHLWN